MFSTKNIDTSLPGIVLSLLQEYEDVFLDEVSSELPSISGIEYWIDLILGASLRNRLAYWTIKKGAPKASGRALEQRLGARKS